MAWVLTVGLARVRAEFNAAFPGRDKTSDGSIGNQAHATGVSGHNPDRTGRAEYKDGDSLDEVRAIDVDNDLVSGSGRDWMELVVQYLIRKARDGKYVPFRYIIYKRRIWSRTDGWRTRVYTGSNAHDKHAHFSGDYSQKADNWSDSLGLASVRLPTGGETVALSQEDLAKIRTETALGIYDALWVAANQADLPDGRLKYSGPGAVGASIRSNLAKLTADPAIAGVVTVLAALDAVDEVALANALAPAVAALVVSSLPEDTDDVTVEELVEAFRRAVAGPTQ